MQSEVYDKRAVLSWDGGGDEGAPVRETACYGVRLTQSSSTALAFSSCDQEPMAPPLSASVVPPVK